MQKENQVNDYKGYALFNDIEDVELRTRNRAVVLANLCEDNTNKEKRITPKGAALVIGYFDKVPMNERRAVQQAYMNEMIQRGFQLHG